MQLIKKKFGYAPRTEVFEQSIFWLLISLGLTKDCVCSLSDLSEEKEEEEALEPPSSLFAPIPAPRSGSLSRKSKEEDEKGGREASLELSREEEEKEEEREEGLMETAFPLEEKQESHTIAQTEK